MKLIYVDLFAGGGGTTTGVHRARLDGERCATVAACVNHDELAIKSHRSNHRQTLHFTEDITFLYKSSRMAKLVGHVRHVQAQFPDAELVLWASLECTNFSKAKGGLPRDADSRTLAYHLYPYIEQLQPDRIQIENVIEFMAWGPLDANGRPVSKTAGVDYVDWLEHVKFRYNYKFEHRILNSADFGAYTSRVRYFGQFVRPDAAFYWPEQTHAKHPAANLFGRKLKPWRAVRDVLDLSDEGSSIFDRPKPLVESTLKRIYAGLIKFVAGGEKAFMLKYNSMSQSGKYLAPDISEPSPVVATQSRLGMVFISKAYSGHPASKVQAVDAPAGTITTKDHHQVVHTEFLSAYYSNGDNTSSCDAPSPTVTTKDRLALVQAKHFLMNPQYNNKGRSLDAPSFTLIARMDKAPPYLVETTSGPGVSPSFITQTQDGVAFHIDQSDSHTMRLIKEFMAMYGILDIKMRMLRIPELKRIMGFPSDYVLVGTQGQQKKFIGNAVEVTVATALVEATARGVASSQIINTATA